MTELLKQALRGEDRGEPGMAASILRQDWTWDAAAANSLASLSNVTDPYDVGILYKHGSTSLRLAVLKEGREIVTWEGNRFSTFAVAGDKLYYADFSPSASGGGVNCVDLKNGQRLWSIRLKGLGPIQHSAYSTQIILELTAHEVVIRGNESGGRYIEMVDKESGKSLGTRVYDPPSVKPRMKKRG